jgi:predicted nucleic acid-binding protein
VGSDPEYLADTSAAVPLVVTDHEHHEQVWDALGDSVLGLAGHAQFETYSVLTRLPPPSRRTPAECQLLIESNFPASRYLSPSQQRDALVEFARLGIAGGSVYDALVGRCALEHGLTLVTRDQRALATYRLLGVSVRVVGGVLDG